MGKRARWALLLAALVAGTSSGQGREVWPTRGWGTSTPAAEGVKASVLEGIDEEFLSGKHGYVDGMLVIRHGLVVFEKSYTHDYDRLFEGKDPKRGIYNYYDPDWHPYYKKGPLHTMQSVTKSVTSTLVAIAMRSGKLPGVESEVRPFFDGFRFQDSDRRWSSMKLRDLLTMTSGIDWDETTVTYTDPKNSCAGMEASENWVQFVLDRPVAFDPGTKFEYNSGATELLAQILRKATGKDPDDYAAERLFRPLGIENWYWKKTPSGLSDTEGGLYLTARDLAKLGYLYLNDGVWEGQRILPAEYLHDSASDTVNAGRVRYGYQWWFLPYEGHTRSYALTARGYGGQYLIVLPEYDVIAVFTGWNIYDKPPLDVRMALERVVESVR